MAATPQVDVVGLRALVRDIKRAGDLESPLGDVLREAGKQATAPVIAATKSALPDVDTPQHPAGALAATVRTTRQRTGAGVRMGMGRLPYAGPIEFGWPSHNLYGGQYLANGRYLFPAAASLASDSAQAYSEALQRGFQQYPWTNISANVEQIHD